MRLLIFISYFFFFSEFMLMLFKRSKKKSKVTRKDRGSLILLWVMICVCLTLGFNIAYRTQRPAATDVISYLGYFLILAGIILRWTSILQLKNAFTVDVAVTEGQALKTDGLYKKIRHPSYLGLLIILTGLSIGMANILSAIVIIIPMFLTIGYRIKVEEKLLTEEFGESYESYKSNSWKLLPGIY
jgi:protein-S-isoprenylcysteine O-methyltransferase Ste14